jgi:hypothetical protein
MTPSVRTGALLAALPIPHNLEILRIRQALESDPVETVLISKPMSEAE